MLEIKSSSVNTLWEIEVATEVTDETKYEPGNVLNLANYNGGVEQFNNPTSDVEILIDDAKDLARTCLRFR